MDGPGVQYSPMILCSGRKNRYEAPEGVGRKIFFFFKSESTYQKPSRSATHGKHFRNPLHAKASGLYFHDNWYLLFNLRILWTPTHARIQDTWDVCFMKWMSLSFLHGAQEKPQNIILQTTHLHCAAVGLNQLHRRTDDHIKGERLIFYKWNCYANQNMVRVVWWNCELLIFCIGSSCLLWRKYGN